MSEGPEKLANHFARDKIPQSSREIQSIVWSLAIDLRSMGLTHRLSVQKVKGRRYLVDGIRRIGCRV